MVVRGIHKQKLVTKHKTASVPAPIIAVCVALLCTLAYMEVTEKTISKNISHSQKLIAGWMGKVQKPKKDSFQSGFAITPAPTSSLISPTITPRVEQKIETTQKVNIIRPTIIIDYHYVYPTYTYPSIKPGDPGSKEWNDEFWKKFEDMGKKNAASQKAVEEAQRQFCEQNPELCSR